MKYTHGGDTRSYFERYGKMPLDFSSNINPYPVPDSIAAAAVAAIGDLAAYPDPYCRELRAALAKTWTLPADWFWCGNGAADVIFRVVSAVKPRRALVTAPTFSEYEAALAANGCDVRRYALRESEDFAITDGILSAADGADMVFICNPNNPTGKLAPSGLLLDLARTGIMLVIDECFLDFTEETSFARHLADFPNVLILRSFTKLYAIPAARLGYCICSDTDLVEKLYIAGPPWNVSAFAQNIGVAALRETEFARSSRERIAAERERLTSELRKLNITVFDGAANYLLIKARRGLRAELETRGILLRSCADYAGLSDEFYRIAVKNNRDNDALLAALRGITEVF
ncbi:MAG: threonine-phosphate decarboxylase CobD [Oscillospiraceae bacterium]|jgi:threonine-phosphate decarboxylase|nr:threonine-phosphate decarboxylase CobD [Oscillospiraceae bacterium]